MDLLQLYYTCNGVPFIHVENGGDYYVEKQGENLYIYFQGSTTGEDWWNNFSFFAKPYKGMKHKWRVHRGFLKVWKSIEPYLESYVADPEIKHILIAGFSQGAAITTLCHEYCAFHRPDLLEAGAIESYGFGQPRVIWGRIPKPVRPRFKGYTYITCYKDIVTHLPPRLFGFKHVGEHIKVGDNCKYGIIQAHLHYHEYLQ